jgi:hypothetical protein
MNWILITILFIISIILLVIVHYQALVIENIKDENIKLKDLFHKIKF